MFSKPAVKRVVGTLLGFSVAASFSGDNAGLDELITLDADNECDGGEGQCALNALQRRGNQKQSHMMTYNESSNLMANPPKRALDYNGMAWPTMQFPGTEPVHFFAIGDWGGMDGTLNPIEGRARMVAYRGGSKPGPSVFPRTRFNKPHTVELCDHKQFTTCYNTRGSPPCVPSCGFVKDVDDKAQLLVADSFRKRAALSQPKLVLNVGDNFYWGGIEKTCGTPMNELSYTAKHQFDQIYEGVYNGAGLDNTPWLSVLGNHDWGGRQFNNGWDQQIAYTWHSHRWIMPAAYYSTTATFPDQGFSVDFFMLDSNAMDASNMDEDPEHNICGAAHNPAGATCASQGGPQDLGSCKQWFWDMWAKEQSWLQEKLTASKADWQIVVTHFPCGHQKEFYMRMHQQFGLDLLVTGHRHDQELWNPNRLGGLTCFVTGGGGGISSEATPDPHNRQDWYGEAQYGFYDLTITKDTIKIESINWNGYNIMSATVSPKAIAGGGNRNDDDGSS
jgi:tartrate-resistant acid phosphatase type 5